MNSSFIIALILVLAPMAFAAFLLFFMMSGKGTKPLDKKEDPSGEEESRSS
jgi:flagellar basal body-associated protein FliL